MSNQKRTKIVATLGPACSSTETLKHMILEGVDVFRINLSHTKIEDLKGIINKLKKWTNKTICIEK